jgi:hypothetical protein
VPGDIEVSPSSGLIYLDGATWRSSLT